MDVRTPNAIDRFVGSRVRARRLACEMAPEALAEALGITPSQVEDYESGAERIGAARLHGIARALDVPVAFFFEEPKSSGSGARESLAGTLALALADPEAAELVRAFSRIRSPQSRQAVLDVARAAEEAAGNA